MRRPLFHFAVLSVSVVVAHVMAGPSDPIYASGSLFYKAYPNRPYGYQRVTFENLRNQPVSLTWEADAYVGGQLALPAIEMAPAEKRTLHLPITFPGHSMGFRVHAGDQHLRFTDFVDIQVLGIDPIALWPSDLERETYSKKLPGNRHGAPLVHYIEPAQAPDNWLCYSPFRMVAIGESVLKSLDSEARNALMEYVRMGGYLSIHSAEKARKEHILQGWIEHRTDHPVKAIALDKAWTQSDPEWMRHYRGMSEAFRRGFPFRTTNPGGRVGGLVIATLFFVLAGPVNYLHFRKRGRIRMLLVTLPAISLAFCLLIGVYFVAAQGFRRKGGTVSLTFVDEARAAALTIAYHSVISGLYPVGGFQFPIDTAFVPTGNDLRPDTNKRRFLLTPTTQVLQSGLFRPGVPFHYVTARPFDTREKLIYDAGKRSVVNGYETDMDALYLFENGKLYTAERLPSQGAANLIPTALETPMSRLIATRNDMDKEGREHVEALLGKMITDSLKEHGTHYVALLKDPPESAAPGVSMTSPGGLHILVGNLQQPN